MMWPFIRRSSAILCVVLFTSCGGRPEATPPSEIREFVFLTPPSDAPVHSLLGGHGAPLHEAAAALADAANDQECEGVFVRVGAFGGAWGRLADIGDGLERVRAAGKPVRCHFDATDNAGYALMAAHCDHISMTPSGLIDLVGLSLQVMYAGALLEELGIEANVLHMGRYKGAGDMFTEDEMPDAARESLGRLLDDLDAALVSRLRLRELDPRAIIDGGPYTSVPALEAHLIDAILFDNQARQAFRNGAHNAPITQVFPPEEEAEFDLASLLLSSDDGGDDLEAPHIVIAHIEGSIIYGESARNGSIASGPFVEAMREFAEDDSVVAVVLRINSPGGSVVASDVMWQAVHELAQIKPVVASIGDIAASGGYYIASAATCVLAHEASIVGSIGVVGGKMNVAGLVTRFHINPVALQRGQNALMNSPFSSFSDSETDAFQRQLRSAYYRFIRRISAGRGLDQAEVLIAAEGRVMSGREGLELRLIDQIGGLTDALEDAHERVDATDLPITIWPQAGGPLAAVGQLLGAQARAEAPVAYAEQSLGFVSPALQKWLWFPALLESEGVLAAVPYSFEIH